jgi:hypothetical protein
MLASFSVNECSNGKSKFSVLLESFLFGLGQCCVLAARSRVSSSTRLALRWYSEDEQYATL